MLSGYISFINLNVVTISDKENQLNFLIRNNFVDTEVAISKVCKLITEANLEFTLKSDDTYTIITSNVPKPILSI